MKLRQLLVGVLVFVIVLPFIWWLCLPGHPGDLHHARSDHGAVLLPNGQVLVIGGVYGSTPFLDPNGVLATWLIYHSGSWAPRLEFLWTKKGSTPLQLRAFRSHD